MVRDDEDDEGPPVTVRKPVVMLEKKVIQLHWADARPRRESLGVTYDTLPTSTQEAPDMRAFCAAEWRDKVRRLYDFRRLKLNFNSITWDFTNGGEEDDRDLMNGDWPEIQELLDRLDDTALGRIRFKTRDVGDTEVIEEYNDVSAVLKSYVIVDAEGVVTAVKDTGTQENIEPTGDDDASKSDDDEPEIDEPAQAIFVERCLEKVAARTSRRRDSIAAPGNPDPRKAFGTTASDKKAVQDEHDGYDVRDPEQLANWQMRMLAKHGAGNVLKSTEEIDPAIMNIAGSSAVSMIVLGTSPADGPVLTDAGENM